MNVTVYTANIGGFDNLRPPQVTHSGARFICYADELLDPPSPWEILPAHLPYPGDFSRNVRVHKLLSHLFTDTPYSIWIDTNFVLAIDPAEAVERWLRNSDIAVFRHPGRSCLYDEARQCLLERIGNATEIERQVSYYEACGFPREWGLFACGVILRRHTPQVIRLNEAWWSHVRDFCERDQISLPFVLREQEVPITVIDGNIYSNESFIWKWHAWKTDHPDNQEFVEQRRTAAERRDRLRNLCPSRGGGEGEAIRDQIAAGNHATSAGAVQSRIGNGARYCVVILSRNASNLIPCVRAVLANEPNLPPERIIVVDDGARAQAERDLPGIRWMEGAEPFVFARNANIGIREASDTVILLNDDALLLTPGGFTKMSQVAAENPDFGLISATTNIAFNPAQYPTGTGLREATHAAFVCALIPRDTWEQVGPLDERYCLDYGVEDRDYCHRVSNAGLKVGIYDFCFVDHGYLVSTYRGDPRASRDFSQNYRLFQEKWGLG
jgi:hypothetical protein